jgi:AraC-like DNA-binding protein
LPKNEQMTFREVLPHPALAPFVDRFWLRAAGGSARSAVPALTRILPDGCVDLLVRLEPVPRLLCVGPMTCARVLFGGPEASTVAVRFRPGGAAPFLELDVNELTDCSVGTEELGLRWLAAGSFAGKQPLAAVAHLQRLLLSRARTVAAPNLRVLYAVESLICRRRPSIEGLARDIGWSRQEQTRAFVRQVGVSPKRFARVARLQQAIAALQRDGGLGLSRAALEHGYYDQAHMARDFRELAGVTPAAAQAHPGSIFPIRSVFELA